MDDSEIPCLLVNEIRDYHLVNAQLKQLLDRGATRVRLTGVEGQRLLLSGIRGPWRAVVEIVGPPGPECAAGLAAPGLTVVAHGKAADGAGRGLEAGALLLCAGATDAVAYRQCGGLLLVQGDAGHRAGLELAGGLLLLLGSAGRLLGERQRGGSIVIHPGPAGPGASHGQRGGSLTAGASGLTSDDLRLLNERADSLAPGPVRDRLKTVFEQLRRPPSNHTSL